MQCNTLAELEKAIQNDIAIAIIINPDRVKIIKQVGEEVANLKFERNARNE